jgi:NAD-dependent dihydropyrimidine dehydrogenase PreA subunit
MAVKTAKERARRRPPWHRRRGETKFVALDRRACEACWKCVDACPKAVLRRVEVGPHRHAALRSPDECTGCLACVKACETGALAPLAAG